MMIPLLIISEIIILCLAATVFLYRPDMRVSEAICSGIIVALLTLSCLYQTVFLIGEPKLAFLFEGILVIASIILLKRRSNYLRLFWRKIVELCQKNKILTVLVGIALIYLGLQAIILPPTGPDFSVYHLPRVLLFQQEKSLYLENITTLRQAIFPVGWNILTHSFLRFYTDYGVGIFPFLVYLAIGCGIYALARQITSEKIAIVTTLVVITMPEVVLQSTSMSNDLPLAGVAVFCFIMLSRLYQQLNIVDVALLILGMTFGLSIKLTFLLFLAPFTLFGSYLLLRKYSFNHGIKFIVFHWKWFVGLIFPAFIFSQVWLYIHNYNYWGGWSGPPDYIDYFKQADGVKGGIANLVRYLFQSIDLMQSTNIITDSLFQVKLSDQLDKIYHKLANAYPFIGKAGMYPNSPHTFRIVWRYMEGYAWYGILGFLLALPSLLYTALRGKNFTRMVSLILIIFFLLVCYKVAWSPWRGRYFSLFFVSSGICIGYTLEHLSLWLKGNAKILLRLTILTCLITLLLTISMNRDKALLKLNSQLIKNSSLGQIVQDSISNNIWSETRFGRKREYKRISRELGNLIPSGSKLALLSIFQNDIYNYILALPDVNIVAIHSSSYPKVKYRFNWADEPTSYRFSNPLKSNPASFDYLLCLDAECEGENLDLPERRIIWHFQPSQEQIRKMIIPKAQLFKLN